MAKLNKKLYIKSGNLLQSVDLYTTKEELNITSEDIYGVIKLPNFENGNTVIAYYKTTDDRFSSNRLNKAIQKNDKTVYVAKQ